MFGDYARAGCGGLWPRQRIGGSLAAHRGALATGSGLVWGRPGYLRRELPVHIRVRRVRAGRFGDAATLLLGSARDGNRCMRRVVQCRVHRGRSPPCLRLARPPSPASLRNDDRSSRTCGHRGRVHSRRRILRRGSPLHEISGAWVRCGRGRRAPSARLPFGPRHRLVACKPLCGGTYGSASAASSCAIRCWPRCFPDADSRADVADRRRDAFHGHAALSGSSRTDRRPGGSGWESRWLWSSLR